MSGGGAEAGVKGDQAVVGSGRIGCGGDVDGASGGRTYGGGGGNGQDGYGDRLSWLEDIISHIT